MSGVEQHKAGEDTAINLTDRAKTHILAYLDQQPDTRGVRFSVKKTGCSGLSYVIDYVFAPEENDIVLPLDNHYLICIDKRSYPFLKGLNIDYIKQGLNQKFVFDNPNQTGQCGCGESFTVDEI